LANIYLERQLPKHLEASIRTAERLQQQVLYKNETYYHHQYHINLLKTKYLTIRHERKTEPNFQELLDSLDAYFIISKLRFASGVYNYNNLFKHEYNIKLIDELLAHIAKVDYSHMPTIQLYYYTLLTLMDGGDKTHFTMLKQLLIQSSDALPVNEMRSLHALARNYCIKRLNNGDNAYAAEVFDLYKLALSTELLFDNGILSQWTYKNIVAAGLKNKEYQWTEEFIYKYKSYLPPRYQEGFFAFNLARLLFEKKQYTDIISVLGQADFDDLHTTLSVKSILLKTYYELDEIEVLFSLLDSFRIYLIRKKGLSYHKDNYLNIIKFTRRLLNLNKHNTQAVEKLKMQIKSTRILTEKPWLLSKLESL
jgi:hypothetical protein